MLFCFEFRGCHYFILAPPFIKVSMPFGETYFLPGCSWTNSPGIQNQAPIRRHISPWRANHHPFVISASNKGNQVVHYPPPVSAHILSDTTFLSPTWDQHIHLPLTPIIHGRIMKQRPHCLPNIILHIIDYRHILVEPKLAWHSIRIVFHKAKTPTVKARDWQWGNSVQKIQNLATIP